MVASEKNIELLKKLKALAERGIEGEQAAAKKILDRLMAKYGIAEEDLSDDKLEDHDFRFHTPQEHKLLTQVMYKVAKDRERYHYARGKGCQTTEGITCTKAEALQIQIEYEFYLKLWQEDLELFLEAFIQKHEIFDMSPGHGTQTIEDEVFDRMKSMMNGMQDRTLRPMLEEGE